MLVNNAGIQRDVDFTRGIDGYRSGDNEIAINREAPIVFCGMFVPLLNGKLNTSIVNVSSGLGFVPAAPFNQIFARSMK
ncbi:MAG: SDR family NAD(P)-dependent oxidoreductase [Spirochaetales bacterium]|nr:SDR family NAD(P)-dependent oxidoreductase [Spirochaetales bacterium]